MATDFPDIVEYRYHDPATDTNYSAYFRDLGSVIAFAIGQLGPNVTPSQVLANLFDPDGKPLADRPDVNAENVTAVAAATNQTVQLEPDQATEPAPEDTPAAASGPTVPDAAGTGQTAVDAPEPAAAEAPGVLTPAPATPVADTVTPIPSDVSTDSGTATNTPDTSTPVASEPFAVSPPVESAPPSDQGNTPADSVDSESTDFDATPDSSDVNTADGPVTADTAPSIGKPINAENSPA